MNARRKQELLKLEAEHLENARFLNRADVVVMTESDEDERFWRAVFNHAVPNLKIMFNCDTYLSLVIPCHPLSSPCHPWLRSLTVNESYKTQQSRHAA